MSTEIADSLQFDERFERQRSYFDSGATRPIPFRIARLKQLKETILANEKEIVAALFMDLRKSDFEAFGTEIGQVIKEIDFTIKHLQGWARPQTVGTPLMLFPSTSKVYRDPLGTVLIIGPWNYPFMLTMSPLVSAIAGGNTIFIKPSEEAAHTALLIEKLMAKTFNGEYVHVEQGVGAEVIPSMMSTVRFDHVFFTGSTFVGQKIMELAAKKLVPVTLELGGKSPCIVDQTASLNYAAKKIAWSKLMNAGQTCVAPDYVLVHSSIKEELVKKLKANFSKMLGDDPRHSEDFGRIINKKRFGKLLSYLGQGNILSGGRYDEADLYIEPTIIEHVGIQDSVMQEEIFGPILPIISYDSKEEVVEWVGKNPFPLSLYIYAEDKAIQDFYISRLQFGGSCINNGLIHLGNPYLPFGGVGPSGTGQYHGKFGFETFTRPKAVLHSRSWFDVPIWYAPFKGKAGLLRKIFKMT
ncbi:MAG: aldehyde dehydrogenase family protein [bacterium]